MKRRERLSQIGIKWRIFASFAGFIAVTLALLWVFQIVFLDQFYKAIKIYEIRATMQTIQKNIDSAELGELLENTAHSEQTCIVISDGEGRLLFSVDVQPACVIHHLNSLGRIVMFEETRNNGGDYFERFSHDNFRAGRQGEAARERQAPRNAPESIVLARLCTRADGSTALILLNSTISPVNATVQTLRVQLVWITCIMLILALLLALFLARRIARPIIEINATAKGLAAGNYEPAFHAEGYREIVELSHTLNYAAAELSKVETLRRDLIANVSHDLRTPLTMIAGYAEVMRDLPGENTPENVQVIIDEASRLTTLVNDMLDLSRMQAGVLELDRRNFCLTESVRGILRRYGKLTDYHILFQADCDVCVLADELKISQVVYNLVNNAITYTGSDKTVRIIQSVSESTVKISVFDSGKGIPQDQLYNIWERYYKVDKEHKRAQVGTGLGLSIVKTILDLHGGRYGVKSEPGRGSEFWFELALAPPQARLEEGGAAGR